MYVCVSFWMNNVQTNSRSETRIVKVINKYLLQRIIYVVLYKYQR